MTDTTAISADDFRGYCKGTLLQQFVDLLDARNLGAGVYHATNNTPLNALASDLASLQPQQQAEDAAAIKQALDSSVQSLLPAAQTEIGTDPATWPVVFTLGLGVSGGGSQLTLLFNGVETIDPLPTPPSSGATQG